MALCVHYTQTAVSVFKRESLVSKLKAILSCHRDEDVDNEIFFFCSLFWRLKSWRMRMLCCERSSSSTASRWLERRHRSEAETKCTGRGTTTQTSSWWGGGKKNKDLWRITFILVNASSPWVPRAQSLHRPIVAVLDCSNPIEITTRYNSAEMCLEKKWPLTTIRVLFSHYLWKRSSFEHLLCFVFM